MPNKILIIRASSFGDIILTTPILRSIKKHFPKSEVHLLIKPKFIDIIKTTPYIDKFIELEGLQSTIVKLKKESYDVVLDLHNNLRSTIIRICLQKTTFVVNKENYKKFQMVKFKKKLNISNIVLRYGEALKFLGAQLDNEGIEVYFTDEQLNTVESAIKNNFTTSPYCLVVGGSKVTRQWTVENTIDFIHLYNKPVILLGGVLDIEKANNIAQNIKNVPLLNAVGRYNILTSAAFIKHSRFVITPDTGLMHLSAGLNIPIITLWGSTVPEFGMTPYLVNDIRIFVKNVSCRPCSKFGYDACPQKHFKCMVSLTPDLVLDALKQNQLY